MFKFKTPTLKKPIAVAGNNNSQSISFENIKYTPKVLTNPKKIKTKKSPQVVAEEKLKSLELDYKKHIDQASYQKWYKGRAVINPITWTTESYASKELHKGFLYTDKRIYKQLFNTHLIDGAVWIDRPKGKFMLMSFTMRNYHIGDINLFWQDIRENAKLRAKNFLENK